MTIIEQDAILNSTGIAKDTWIRLQELHVINVRADGTELYDSGNQLIKFMDHGIFIKNMNKNLTGTLVTLPKKDENGFIKYFSFENILGLKVVREPMVGDTVRFYRNKKQVGTDVLITEVGSRSFKVDSEITPNFDAVGFYIDLNRVTFQGDHMSNLVGPFRITLTESNPGHPFHTFISLANIQSLVFKK